MLKWRVDVWKMLEEKCDHVFVDLKGSGEISQHTLVRLHQGECSMTFKSLDALCRILDCQPGDILEYVKED